MTGLLVTMCEAALPGLMPLLHSRPVVDVAGQAEDAVRQYVKEPKDRARLVLILKDLAARLEERP